MSNKHAVKEAPASYQSTPVPSVNRELQSFITGNPLTENLNLWISATKAKSTSGRGSNKKIELVGIKKLRELILELAVRGKLVPQNPEDEPASELLKKIDAEKNKLVKEGKIKKQKPLPAVSEDEKPFELPEGWAWIKLGNLLSLEYGDNLPSAKRSNTGEYPVYGSNGVVGTHNKAFINEQCIVIGRKGSAGALNLCESSGCCVTDVAYFCIPHKSLYLKYIFQLLHTIGLDSLGKGIKPGLNRNEAYTLTIALPPLAEQHRIVAKVDELMALCDQLEQHSEHQLDAHKQLVETLLATLVESENADELATNWQRLAEHFDTLFSGALTSTTGIGNGGGEWAIDRLKDTILQLAVMGKLVPQNPDDEPASELLKKIETEKARLVKEGKIKKQKPLPAITDEEKPFELPEGWSVVFLEKLAHIFAGCSFKSEDFKQHPGVRVIKISNVGVGQIEPTEDFLPNEFANDYSQYLVSNNDLVIALTRPYISSGLKVSICNEMYNGSLLNQRVAAIRPYINGMFLYKYLQSEFVLGMYMKRFGNSGLQPNLKMEDVTQLIIPVPPLTEQKRIVAKVDELFALCDQLKARLQAGSETQLTLMEALVEGSLRQ